MELDIVNKKPSMLKKGDKVAIVSLSKGILGMPFIKHELDLGINRLKQFGLNPVIMPNSLKDIKILEENPKLRADDLKAAFLDISINAIICAIGGDDSYKIIDYLMSDKEFINAVRQHPKIFLGFSDSTNSHLMLNKIGLSTFYGQAFLTDIAELGSEMLPYTKYHFDMLFENHQNYLIESSPIWYLERQNYGPEALGTQTESKIEKYGYEVLNGKGVVCGKLYGGCLDSLYDIYFSERYGDENQVYTKYNILPTIEQWKQKILFIETSEEKMPPEKLKKILDSFNELGILKAIKALLVGKPIDEIYYNEYKDVYKEVFKNLDTAVLYNINFGHCSPRCIIPYDAECKIDLDNKTISIISKVFNEQN